VGRRILAPLNTLWERHERLYTEVFVCALLRLARSTCDVSHENIISEALCPILAEVCFEEWVATGREVRTPDWEKPIQPVSASELRGGKAGKRPDFTCKLINPQASSAEEYELQLHIECKRLGKPVSSKWIFNENYVVEGILRFDSNEHEYGKCAMSGIMVGYIVSMTANEILSDIEYYHQKHLSKPANIIYQSNINKVSQYRQRMKRQHIKPVIFDIVHLWVDLNRQSSLK